MFTFLQLILNTLYVQTLSLKILYTFWKKVPQLFVHKNKLLCCIRNAQTDSSTATDSLVFSSTWWTFSRLKLYPIHLTKIVHLSCMKCLQSGKCFALLHIALLITYLRGIDCPFQFAKQENIQNNTYLWCHLSTIIMGKRIILILSLGYKFAKIAENY